MVVRLVLYLQSQQCAFTVDSTPSHVVLRLRALN